ncbi:helix-turn-helix domain-containing protein [Streptomyces sp. TRM 70351]|uniref:PucR family transcriptional regulator n=1 Tax=Streptomyces sp. TRM 70351 TaxID=3116552 RepID=UPI002E7B7CB0|nr:helix-turn-helix domain-containing protein [Streptomyces sp. TRM 70351]MEE1927040.1 helix-turn-helix domain-containing protein [Streptomyces sp. TRM 70351]
MTSAIPPAGLDEPQGPLPKELAAVMRPELPSLLHEIGAEIRRAIPEYGPLLDGPYGPVIQGGVEQNLVTFVDRIAAPSAPTTRRDQLCRKLGRYEAYRGRTLDNLQAAFRIGARVALRRAKKLGKRYSLSPAVMLSFADALFGYVDELIEVSREGYQAAQAELGGGQEEYRRMLLQLILAGASVPRSSLAGHAERARWPLPSEVTLVAISPDSRPPRGSLGDDVLAAPGDPQPHALLPGPVEENRRLLLDAAPREVRIAVGLTVPLAQAAESLRWARQALALVEAGVIPAAPVTYCDDHLLTLWLCADSALTEQLARRQLAPLADLTRNQRERLVETLQAWLDTRGNAVQMAELLHLHPQTVRYRLRNLDRAFGARLSDLDDRFATEVVLRSLRLRRQASRPAVEGRRP